MNHTTEVFPRTSRATGTEYAASIEHKRRSNKDSILIVVVCSALVCLAYGLGWLSI